MADDAFEEVLQRGLEVGSECSHGESTHSPFPPGRLSFYSLYPPSKRKFRLIYRSTSPDRVIECENIRIEHGFVIFTDGPEYSQKSNLRAYSTLNMSMIQEVFDGKPDSTTQAD